MTREEFDEERRVGGYGLPIEASFDPGLEKDCPHAEGAGPAGAAIVIAKKD